MKTNLLTRRSLISRLTAVTVLISAFCFIAGTKTYAADQAVIVDKTHTGPYKALADLAMIDLRKGDIPGAIAHARILEAVWDRGETEMEKNQTDKWKKIDDSLDAFIKPIIAGQKKAPDLAAVEEAYKTFRENLKIAD